MSAHLDADRRLERPVGRTCVSTPRNADATRSALLFRPQRVEGLGVTPAHAFDLVAPETMEDDMSSDLLRPLAPGDDDPVLALLKAGIPLSLLLDLATKDPQSAEIYATEGSR